MMAVPRFPRRRPASRLAYLLRAVRRAWLVHKITGAEVEIGSLQRMIDNDVAVMRKYPDMTDQLRPIIDTCFLEQQAIAQRLNSLKLKLMNFDRTQ